MKIIEPKVEYWKQNDSVEHVAKCARICYGKETGNDVVTITNLIKKKHLSMFRHETIYIVAPYKESVVKELTRFNYCPYINYFYDNKHIFISTNGQFIRECSFMNNFNNYIVDEDTFLSIDQVAANLRRFTFKVTTQISTSRELNRVSPNNIAERSTRYVYEDGTICRPHWINEDDVVTWESNVIIPNDNNTDIYLTQCNRAFNRYKTLVDNGMHRQDARGILPLDTATECIYTYTISEWRDIIDLRYYGTTGKPHPNAKIIAGLIREQLIELGYDFD